MKVIKEQSWADEISIDHFPVIGQRFRVRSLLKRSNGVDTLLGTELSTNEKVVIKSASRSSVDPVVSLRLSHEAEILGRMQSDYFAPLLCIEENGGRLFIVTPFVDGITLQQRLSAGPLNVEESLSLGIELFSALVDIHGQGVLHRDIKPANLIVNSHFPINKLTLIDLGFARSDALALSVRNKPVGTARYISPEQAGLLETSVDERSDLYSAGLVLFECLTGQPLFVGNDLGEILKQHLNAVIPDMQSINPRIPRSLYEVVNHLMRKDPSDRYQTAYAALADLKQIRDQRKIQVSEFSTFVVGLKDRRKTLTQPAFVGRERELRELERAYAMASQGRGGLLLLGAESGAGKSRLLEEFARKLSYPVRAPGVGKVARIFSGQSVDQTVVRPFQLLMGVVCGILETAEAVPSFAQRLQINLEPMKDLIVAGLPELEKIFGMQVIRNFGPETFGEQRNLRAISSLLDELGTAENPVVVLMDDCQWADEFTVKLIDYWAKQINPDNKRYLLIVASYRSEEMVAEGVSKSHSLMNCQTIGTLTLDPLGSAEIQSLVKSMGGDIPLEAVELVEQISGGSPFMISAVLNGLVESKALFFSARGWQFENKDLEVRSSQKAAAFLVRRFRLLPDEMLQFLILAAVLGKEFRVNFAGRLANLDSKQYLPYIREAQRRHIIWWKEEGVCAFLHDKLRETLLKMVEPSQIKDLHFRTAERLEREHPPDYSNDDSLLNFDLAYHFDEAGLFEKAFPFALKAAEAARRRHSLEHAERHYRIAERGAALLDSKAQQEVAEKLGEVLMLRGDYKGAGNHFQRALSLAENNFDRARLDAKLGELHFKQGEVLAASAALIQGLNRIGRKVPNGPWAMKIFLGWELLVQLIHSLFPKLILKRRKPPDAKTQLALAIYSRLAYTFWFGRGRVACAWVHFKEMNLAERYPDSAELAQAYSEHGPVMTMVPWFSRGIKYVKRSLELREKFSDQWGKGQSLHFYGVNLYGDSRYQECIEKCEAAVKILEIAGDRWESNTANWHTAYCHYRLGDWKRAVEISRREFQQAVDIGDHSSAGIFLSLWSKASGGDIPRDLIASCLKNTPNDVHTTAEILQAEAIHLMRKSDLEGASLALQNADVQVTRAGLSQEYVAPILPWLTTVLRTQVENTSQFSHPKRKQLLGRAFQVAKRAYRVARKYKNNLPHILRELGYLEALRGNEALAEEYFNESLSIAETQKARCEYDLTLVAKARVGSFPGSAFESENVQEALRRLRNRGCETWGGSNEKPNLSEESYSLADRFEKILESARSIVGSSREEELFDAIEKAAEDLFRVKHCVVLKLEETPSRELQMTPVSRDFDPKTGSYFQSMAKEAIREKRPVLFVGDGGSEASESVVLSNLRSALCAPIFVRGRMEFLFFVTHDEIQNLFGEDEKRIATFISTLAGATLENIRLMTSIKEHSEQLIQSNSELERFAFVASHDLKEPLRVIHLYTELLEKNCRSKLDERDLSCMSYIIGGTDRMRQLIDDLLVYSRVGAMENVFEMVDSSEVMGSALMNLEAAVVGTNAKIGMSPRLPVLQGNRMQLIQLFQNLIGNALKFRSADCPQVSVEVERKDRNWIFKVVDNGIGFDPRFADSIFVLFKKLHNVDKYPGTGIGLAICRRIMERHGGRIWAESKKGKGSVFYCSFPIVA